MEDSAIDCDYGVFPDRPSLLSQRLFPVYDSPDFLVKSAVFVVKWPVRLCDFPDHPAGIACRAHIVRNVFCHHAAGTDHHIIPDFDTRKDNAASADPNVVSEGHGDTVFVAGISAFRVDWMPRRIDGDIGPKQYIFPDRDLCHIQHDTAGVCIKIFPQLNVPPGIWSRNLSPPFCLTAACPGIFWIRASDGKRRFWRMSKKYMGPSRKIRRRSTTGRRSAFPISPVPEVSEKQAAAPFSGVLSTRHQMLASPITACARVRSCLCLQI